MKKIILSLVAVMAFTFSANAQEANNIKINPLGLIIGSINLGYERAISEKVSLQLNPGYWSGFKVGDDKFKGLRLGLEGRYFLSKSSSAPDGFYVGPYFNSQNLSVKTNGDEDKLSITSIGGQVGNQWVYDSGFVLDLNLGLGATSTKATDLEPNESYDVNGTLPKFTVALGYNF